MRNALRKELSILDLSDAQCTRNLEEFLAQSYHVNANPELKGQEKDGKESCCC
jgi:hypothetical protein